MKMNKFLMGLGAIAAMSMAACSSDEPANITPDVPTFSEDQAYIAVKIAEQTGKSRAEGDINQEGTGENTGNWFEDGSKLGESNVKSCDFYFYDEAGKYVMTSNTLWADNGQNMPNIELKGQSVVVLDQVKEKGYPKFMVAILNKPEGFTAPLTLEQMNTKLVNIANVTTSDGAVRLPGETDYFTMTTTSWAGQTLRTDANKPLPYYFVTELTKDDFYTSPTAAKEADKAVKVYVERLAAKAAVGITMKAVEGLANTYSIELSVAGAGNNDEGDYISDYQLYVELTGWNFNATPKDSYYMKNINEDWTEDYLGFMWNSTDYKRSYWGKSYTYGVGTQADYNYFSYDKLTNKFWISDNSNAEQNAAYTAENTHPADFINQNANYNKVTSILLQARVYDPKAAADESSDFVMYNGLIFKGDRFMQYAMSVAEANIWVKVDETKYVEVSTGYSLVNDGNGNKVYTEFAPVAGTAYYKKTTNDEGKTVYEAYSETDLATEVTALNTQLKETVGEGFKGGMMYYNIPIRHLRTILDTNNDGVLDRTFAQKNLLEGDYGVVRNHYYRINIKSLAKLGTGVWNPEKDIVPENPPKDEEYYVGAEIHILSWRIVDNSVDL